MTGRSITSSVTRSAIAHRPLAGSSSTTLA
jgi:hypothetical protein